MLKLVLSTRFKTSAICFVLFGSLAFVRPAIAEPYALVEQRNVTDPEQSYQTINQITPARSRGLATANSIEQDPVWEIFNQLQSLQLEVGELRGLIEQQAYEIDQLKIQQKQHYIDLDQRLEFYGAGGLDPKPLANKNQEAAPRGEVPNADDKSDYDQALQLIKEKKFPGAEKSLQAILNRNPQGFYAPFAHYWLGEIYLAVPKPRYDLALQHFALVVKDFPDNSKAPSSLYKMGTIYDAEKKSKKAQETLQDLLKKYPESSEAKMAVKFLEKF